jgi:hypothetical protein
MLPTLGALLLSASRSDSLGQRGKERVFRAISSA